MAGCLTLWHRLVRAWRKLESRQRYTDARLLRERFAAWWAAKGCKVK